MREYLLAFDLGTTGNKAVLVNTIDGAIVGSVVVPYATVYLPDGGAEQSPDDWWRSAITACNRLRDRYPREFAAVIAIGCGGMMNGLVAVDSSGNALGNALIHADIRARAYALRLESDYGIDAVYARTLNRPDSHLTLPKAMWLADNQPETVASCASIVQANDYLAGKLTSVTGITDPSNASLTGGYDPVAREWVVDLWSASGLDPRILPNVMPSCSVLGRVSSGAAQLTQLREGVPVVVGGGDGACASAGSGVGDGEGYLYLGGTSWIGLVGSDAVRDTRLSSYCCLDERLTSFGTVQAAGSSVEWIAKLIGGDSPHFAQLDNAAVKVMAGSERLFFLPYLQGERAPVWDDRARGVFFGLATHHDGSMLYRSVLEGVAYALRSICDVFAQNQREVAGLRLLGGGSSSRLWSEMLASVLNRPLAVVNDRSSATSLGAAMAAGVGAGCWSSIAEAARMVRLAENLIPNTAIAAKYERFYTFWSTLYPAMQSAFGGLSDLKVDQ